MSQVRKVGAFSIGCPLCPPSSATTDTNVGRRNHIHFAPKNLGLSMVLTKPAVFDFGSVTITALLINTLKVLTYNFFCEYDFYLP